ncbi:hypothetical protein pb186bvf_008448 [Paramecium bursaria]
MKRREIHLKTDAHTESQKSSPFISTAIGSPFKFPPLKTIQGDDGTVFSLRKLVRHTDRLKTLETKNSSRTLNEERKEIQQLQQWTEVMAKSLREQKFNNIQEFYHKLELIYTGSLKQLCQYLSTKCIDYGSFIENMWFSFTGAVEEIIDKQCVRNMDIEKELLIQTSRMHELYQSSLQDKSIRLVEAEKDLKRNREWAEKLDKENKYIRRKLKRLENDLTDTKNDQQLMLLQYQELIKENESLKMFQNQQLIKHKIRYDLTYEQLEAEFEEELYKSKKEIWDDFKKKFDDQTYEFEQAYKKRLRDLERNDDKLQNEEIQITEDQHIIFKDMCVGNTIHQNTQSTSTKDLIQTKDQSVWVFPSKKKTDEIQTQTSGPIVFNQSNQADFAVIKRECVARNELEQIYLEMSYYPLELHINDFYELKINKNDLNSKKSESIIEEFYNTLNQRITTLFNIYKMKEDIFIEDFDNSANYIRKSYQYFKQIINDLYDIIQNLKDECVSRKIQIFETEIDRKQAIRHKTNTTKQFDTLLNKYQDLMKTKTFYEKTLKQLAKYAPNYQLDKLRKSASRKRIKWDIKINDLEFQSSERTKTQISQSSQGQMSQTNLPGPFQQQQSSPQVTAPLSKQQSFAQQQTIPDIIVVLPTESMDSTKQIRRRSFVNLEDIESSSPTKEPREPREDINPRMSLLFPDYQQDESESSSEEEIDIDTHLNPIKNLLSIEKKLFISRCTSKNTQVATQAMMTEIQGFRRDKKENLLKLVTLQKQYIIFVQWCVKNKQFNYPMHVLLYEYFAQEFFSQPQSVWLQKLARIVKSIIYYKKKSAKAKLFYDMMVGDKSFSIYLKILNEIQQKDFIELSIIVSHNQLIDEVNKNCKQQYQKQLGNADYDQEMQNYLTMLYDYQMDNIQQQYDFILQLFNNDGNQRMQINQFRILMQELENLTEKQLINIFTSECDEEQYGTQYMTFRRFSQICQELKLLTNLDQYLKLNDVQYFKIIELWKIREIELKLMLIRSGKYDSSERDLFNKMNQLTDNRQRIILGRYLERRAKELLLQKYTNECLGCLLVFDQKNIQNE